jgi:hypothetical protein
MDIIDNLIYATYVSPLRPSIPILTQNQPQGQNRIVSDYTNVFPVPNMPATTGGSYTLAEKLGFCAYNDPSVIERSVIRHLYDIDARVNYDSQGLTPEGGAVNGVRLVSFENSSTYRLIYAYLLENTRILQIFERLIEKYVSGEELGISNSAQVVTWIHNAEDIFFKNSIRSEIRPSSDATRRNAYWRMFGMDLAFGDINSQSNSIPYHKAKSANQQFIVLFEKYLSEVWQGYINARNSSGENTTDINVITDLATQLRELLIARRGVFGLSYTNQNLAKEEFYSVLIASWFTFIISHNSPVVDFLNCQSSTIGERLLKIGTKVGVPAHSKCQYLFEMAGAASNILTLIEAGGFLDNSSNIQTMLSALNPPPAVPPPAVFINSMQDFLTVINNWEKATGHSIKNPETSIRSNVKIQQTAGKHILTTN